MPPSPAPQTRQRILVAAEALSFEAGAAHISLDAVAARAGVSKGGLLYHFPTKQALMRALVEDHVTEMRQALERIAPGCLVADDPLPCARAYLRALREKLDLCTAPPGIFTAIAEDPDFIAPLRRFQREMVERVFLRCPDPDLAMAVYLACQGLVHIDLTDSGAMTEAERACAFATLDRLLG